MIRLIGDGPSRIDLRETALAWTEEVTPDTELMAGISAGLLLIDGDLQILRSNAPARRCLGLGLGDESVVRLSAHSLGGRTQEFRRLVRESISRGARNTMLLRETGPDALICSVAPLNSVSPLALIVLVPLLGGSPDVVPHLRSLFKLSNAEAEIAAAAATGMDVVQMAQSRNVSIHTLRAQIAAIKAKMGLSRMTEIAVTVGRIDAAVTWF